MQGRLRGQSARGRTRLRAGVAAGAMVAGGLVVAQPPLPVAAAPGTITGTVFRDFNADGYMNTTPSAALPAIDLGVGGVTVTAYDATGAVVGTAVTDATPGATLGQSPPDHTSSTDQVRVEFEVPDGYLDGPHGEPGAGVRSGTAVQFVADDATGVNFGIAQPGDYAQNDPVLVIPQTPGAPKGLLPNIPTIADSPTLYALQYATTGVPGPGTGELNKRPQATFTQTGSIWGVAEYGRDVVFSGKTFRRHSPVGSDPMGQIYLTEIDTGTPNAAPFVEIPDAGASPRPSGADDLSEPYDWFHDPLAAAPVFRIGLGDIDTSVDLSTLYAVNLADRQLYAVELVEPTAPGGLPTAGTVTAIPMPLDLPGAAATCDADYVHPYALEADVDGVYAGFTCVGPAVEDLRAFVYHYDEAAATWDASPAFEMSLDYPRGLPWWGQLLEPADWQPWTDTPSFALLNGLPTTTPSQPQPMLSDLELDVNGDLTLSFMDRFTRQTGTGAGSLDTADPTIHSMSPAGELVRACGTPATGWTLENGGVCGDRTGFSTSNNQGPGGGEFYHDDIIGTHDQLSMGATEQIPGFADLITAQADAAGWFWTDGYRKVSNYDGSLTNGTEIAGNGTNEFGKAGSLGDIEALLDPAPVEIGNRVWFDTDGDGIQDADELPIAGVEVTLHVDPDGDGPLPEVTHVATTNADGTYYFSSAPGTSTASALYGIADLAPGATYHIEVPTDLELALEGTTNYTTVDGTLPAQLTVADADGSPNGDERDSDADQDNGSTDGYTVLAPGANDHSHDFGYFTGLSLGNLVWFDTGAGANADNGVKDDDELPATGVTVTLLAADGSVYDADPATPGVQPLTATTDAEGYYRFDGLAAGDYRVGIDATNFEAGAALEGYLSSTGVTTTFEAADNDTDHGEDAADPVSTGVQSAVVTLGAANPLDEVDADAATPAGQNGPTGDGADNLTVDFGFVRYVDLTITKSLTAAGPYQPGDTVSFGLVVTNNGPGTASTGFTVTDRLPAGLSYDAAPSGTDWSCAAPAGQEVTCTYGGAALGSGASAPALTVTATLGDPPFASPLTNSAYVAPAPGDVETNPLGDPDPYEDGDPETGSNNDDEAEIPVELPIDLELAKALSSGTGPYFAGDTATFDLTVTNNGPGTAQTGFTVTDRLPAGLSFAATQPTGTPWDCAAPVGQELTCVWTGAALASGETTGTALVVAAVVDTPVSATSLTNDAYVVPAPDDVPETVPVGDPDPYENGDPAETPEDPSNNDDSAPIPLAVYDLALAKVAVTTSVDAAGDEIEWTIRVRNQGTVESGAFQVTDTPPTGIAPASCSPLCVDAGDGTVRWDITDSLAPGEHVDLRLTTRVTDIDAAPFRNWAEISADSGDDQDSTPDFDTGADDELPNDDYVSQVLDDLEGDETPGDEDDNDDAIVGRDIVYSLGNRLWFDTGAGAGEYDNGAYDDGELPVVGAEVELLDADGQPIDPDGSGPLTRTLTTTDSDGYYRFDGLGAFDYQVLVTPENFQDGGVLETYLSATPTSTDHSAAGNNADHGVNVPDPAVSGIASSLVNPAASTPLGEVDPDVPDGGAGDHAPSGDDTDNLTVDFGFVQTFAVGDYVWVDTDRDGTQDDDEPALPGVTVELQNPDGSPALDAFGEEVPEATTDPDGHYVFDGVPPGDYIVVFTPPAGYLATDPGRGGDPADDSNPDATGVTPPFTVTPGGTDQRPVEPDDGTVHAIEINPTIDAGFVPVVAVGDYTWVDADRDGVQDDGEPALPGVTVSLQNPDGTPATHVDGTPVAEEVTDGDGWYLFDDLLPGEYQVVFTLPDGYVFTRTGGGTPATDSNPDPDPADPSRGVTPVFSVEAEVLGDTEADTDPATAAVFVNPTIDAGVVPVVAVGDHTWLDTDRDGVQDDGEPPLPGVTVELLDPDGSPATHPDGSPVADVVTDEDGHYVFDDLRPGDYRIRFTPPDGERPTVTGGGDAGRDSDPGDGGVTPVFTIGSAPGGNTRPSQDADGVTARLINPTIDAGFVTAGYDLVLTKTFGSTDEGAKTLTWNLRVQNLGPDAATGTITVVDELPDGLIYEASTGDATCAASGRTVTCTLDGGLAAGQSVTITVVTGYDQLTSGITNSATVSGGGPGERTASNNVSSATAPFTGELPATGSDIGTALRWAAGAVLLGLAAVAFVRRRRPVMRG